MNMHKISTIQIEGIYNEDCVLTITKLQEGSIDLVVTSPPYDNLRTYTGFTLDIDKVVSGLYRIIKAGGVVVWVTNDATIKGSESGTSFRTALKFIQEGFNLHDTMIWVKPHFANPSSNRCHQVFEYMFVFTKGKPKTFNPIKDVPIKYGKPFGKTSLRLQDGSIKNTDTIRQSNGSYGGRSNVWRMNTVGQQNIGTKPHHPAMFPIELAKDHIKMWSNENDIVYDPFLGGGTTGKAALILGRKFLGSEISTEYCKSASNFIYEGSTTIEDTGL